MFALAGTAAAQTSFSSVGQVANVGQSCMGIAFDGNQWHIARLFEPGWRNFDAAFSFLGTTNVPGAQDSLRGLAFDQASGHLFLSDFGIGTISPIREVTLGGTILNTFDASIPVIQAIAINPSDGTLWLLSYDQGLRHVTRTGAPLGFFPLASTWTGAAYDDFRGTLLLLGNNDIVHEFTPTGTDLGVVTTDAVAGNGLGLHYDSDTGRLHVTSQEGRIHVWKRPGRLDSFYTLDFETDSSGNPIPHGARIDDEFGHGVFPIVEGSVNDSGLNTVAVLNSDTGPASQDPDLLVGHGNVLILQTDDNTNECPPGSGIFCSHNDDEDGGTLRFAWPAMSVSLASVTLIDCDASDGAWSVMLSDGVARRRTYTVPGNWTGDHVLDGPAAGVRALDLTTLAPQPGFGATATAAEDPGFDPADVVRVEVVLGGSGAVDDLRFRLADPRSFPATVATRNGSGRNRMILTGLARPVLGSPWAARLDCSRFGEGLASLSFRRRPLLGTRTLFGELLIAGELLHEATQPFSHSATDFSWTVPNDPTLIGLPLYVQGACRSTAIGSGRFVRGGGLSNALDLTLGF